MNNSAPSQLHLSRFNKPSRSWELSSHFSLSELPSVPGTYLFEDKNGNPLYIGKSRSLRARVSSYFRSASVLPAKTRVFRRTSTRLTVIPCESDFEAILLEARLIKLYRPKYNIQLKDDKSPLYIVVTRDEFPKILLKRKTDLLELPIREAFGPFLSGTQTQGIVKKVRRIVPFCNKVRHDGKPCFWWHLGLCPGVCLGLLTKNQYEKTVKRVLRLLSGDIAVLKRDFVREMNTAVQAMDFEHAARARDALQAIEETLSQSSGQEDLVIDNRTAGQKLVGLGKLFEQAGMPIRISPDTRIEGFDVSDLGGRMATASMVVWIGGLLNKASYRRFKIHSPSGPNDVRMIAEAVRRRLLHPEWGKPDLVVIDGGVPQLRAIQAELSATTKLPGEIPFVGLVKGIEKLVIPTGHGYRELVANRTDYGLQVLMALRDEAHRFARVYHHWLRDKALVQ